MVLSYDRDGYYRFDPLFLDGTASNAEDEGRFGAMAGAGYLFYTGSSAGSDTGTDFATANNTESSSPDAPDTYTIPNYGSLVSGSVSDLLASDGTRMVFASEATPLHRIEVEFSKGITTVIPSEIAITFEGHVSSASTITQEIWVKNQMTSTWELLDTRAATKDDDSKVILVIKDDPARYISSSSGQIIELKVNWTGGVVQWQGRIDQFKWDLLSK